MQVLLKHLTSIDLDDLLNIVNDYFDLMVDKIYSKELELNKYNTSATEPPFLDLALSISNDIIPTKCIWRPFFNDDVPRSTSIGLYIC